MRPDAHKDAKKFDYPEASLGMMPKSVSMIVSNYNHSEFVRRVLWQLSHTQDFTPVDFEVLVCDSGSNEENQEMIECLLLLYGLRLNMKYIYVDCSELRKEVAGFNGFAYCINAGLKQATGDVIVYSDSSILLPRNYLWDITFPHRVNDKAFVRSPLYNANKEQSNKIINGNKWDKWDSYGPFKHSHGRPSWSVKRENILAVGGLDEEMKVYGVIDDDLVTRLIIYGCKNLMSKSNVLHLYHEETRGTIGNGINAAIMNKHIAENKFLVNEGKDWGKHTWIKEPPK